MSSLLDSNESLCDRFQEWLEASQSLPIGPEAGAARGSETAPQTYENLLAAVPSEHREHVQACLDCREAAADLVAVQELLRDLDPAPVAGPWFAPRVMANIASQEAELSRVAGTWLAVPRFAARLSWVAAVLLICSCTWLYERPVTPPAQTATAFASEHLFDPASLPPNQDDVLVSMNEKDQ
jgi:hypothetical protein